MASSVISHVDTDVQAAFQNYLEIEEAPLGDTAPPLKAASEETPAKEEAPEVEEPAVETAAEEEETTEDPQLKADAEKAAESEAEYIDTWSEMAESLEFDPNELLNHLQIEGRDGEGMVSLAATVDHYRRGPDMDAATRVEVDRVTSELREEAAGRFKELEQLTARMIAKIERHKPPQGGWPALKSENPTEYIRLTEAHQADRTDAEAAIKALETEADRMKKEGDKTDAKYEQEQSSLTFKMRPDWRDEAVGKVAYEDIRQHLAASNYTPDEIRGLVDARSILIAWQAAQYAKSQAKKPRLLKRLRKLPAKHVAASARDEEAPGREQNKARQATLDKFRETGKIEDGMALFEEHV